MTLVDSAASLAAMGVPPPSNAAVSSVSALAGGGVGKKYRPAAAKTFQCRGYGECRMVFSRSEHLARHIRKHTGERPFTCHCSKQFSRLDNLRQHAQTVHSDKAALNEGMMRELTTLHATMVAGNPTPALRRPSTKRARAAGAVVKREPVEDVGVGVSVGRQRPGTSTGYEGAAAGGYFSMGMERDMDRERSSFLAPGSAGSGSGGSFSSRPFSSGTGAFPAANADSISPGSSSSFPNPSGFPAPPFSSGGSRPSTGSGARLPPLSAVVSASAFRPASGHGIGVTTPTSAANANNSILLPNSLTLRRPSTSDWEWGDGWSVRPGTAPGKLATAAAAFPVDDSPFSFHPPDQQPVAASLFGGGGFGGGFGSGRLGSSGGGNPRKRAFGGPDGPYGAHPDEGEGYEYGSESRPQSRRLSVMELCNDDVGERPTSSSLGLSAIRRAGSAERERERPPTTGGLISRASALVLHD
ncbi:hypothetical protein R3P38DRAFT_2754572, partial [Favolaschia claudopus]